MIAARPARSYPTRAEAERAYLKTAGLTDKADPAGITATDDGWQLTLDPYAFAVGAPDMPGLLAAARCPVTLAAGERDPMSRPEQLRVLSADAVTLPGLGHNAHVEDPTALLPLLDRQLR
jgi:pimeloyl-ACP methyl ester carboxylesterase